MSKCQTYSQLKTTLNGNCQTDFECGNYFNSDSGTNIDLECPIDHDDITKYELTLPTDKTFTMVHGNITLHYTVYILIIP